MLRALREGAIFASQKYAQYCAVVTQRIPLNGYRKETIAQIRALRNFHAEKNFFTALDGKQVLMVQSDSKEPKDTITEV